jgi:DNA transformation protein and related proteins
MRNQFKAPNIGKILSDKLLMTGIRSLDELKAAGSENVFIRIKTIDKTACLNMLFALEGAIQGIRWHDLDINRKNELKDFFERLK